MPVVLLVAKLLQAFQTKPTIQAVLSWIDDVANLLGPFAQVEDRCGGFLDHLCHPRHRDHRLLPGLEAGGTFLHCALRHRVGLIHTLCHLLY